MVVPVPEQEDRDHGEDCGRIGSGDEVEGFGEAEGDSGDDYGNDEHSD